MSDGQLDIKSVRGLQIVNSAKTIASIHRLQSVAGVLCREAMKPIWGSATLRRTRTDNGNLLSRLRQRFGTINTQVQVFLYCTRL